MLWRLVQVFITCRLGYCNLLLHGVLQKIRPIQNSATRLVTRTQQCERITPVLRKLHWLPICRRVKFKLACLLPISPDVGWTNIAVSGFRLSSSCRHWPPSASFCIWEDMCCSTHTTVLATEVSLLLVLMCGMACRLISDRTCTPSLFHSRLKTYLFHKSFPP